MNFRYLARQLGLLTLVLSALLVLIALWALLQWRLGDAAELQAVRALVVTAAGGVVAGGLMCLFTRSAPAFLGRREALLLVSATWILGAALSAFPFFLWAHFEFTDAPHIFHNFVDCYFESMSGLTTTGATVLTDIERLPRSLLLWRALTHWLGGIGIVVLFVAVLPMLGVGAKKLVRVETTGPSQQGVRATIRETARVLLLIYLGLSAAAFVMLAAFTEMDWFDSLCHTFSMLSTGGFSTKNTSLAYYDSMSVDLICSVFMLVAGVNFALYYQMTQRRFDVIWKDTELRVYLILKIIVIFVVFLNLRHAADGIATILPEGDGWQVQPNSRIESARYSTFVGISMQTGTGFCTGNYSVWPVLSQIMLIGLMFIGGSAGSTAGGIKVVRFWITAKVLLAELERAFRPNVVRPVKFGGGNIEPEVRLGAIVFVVIFCVLSVIGAFLIGILEESVDFMTGMTASLSCISNVGPGLGNVGPADNFGFFTSSSKLVMSILMAMGRLEMFAILVLFTPRYWKGD